MVIEKASPKLIKFSKKFILYAFAFVVFCVGVFWIFCIYRANRTIDQLKSDDWRLREEAMQSLSKSGKPTVGPLITALKDTDGDIRWRAAKALGEIEDSRAIEPLADALKDEDRRVRYRAIESLGKIGDTRCIKPLVSVLKDEDIDIRESVVRALEEIGKPAIESLIIALRDENVDIRQKALVSLIRTTGENFGRDPEEWQNWWEENKDKSTIQE